jgi:hypothetical protein
MSRKKRTQDYLKRPIVYRNDAVAKWRGTSSVAKRDVADAGRL